MMNPPLPAIARRARLLGWTVVILLASLPLCLPLFIATVVGLPLIGLFGAGAVLAVPAIWLTRQLADGHRVLLRNAFDLPVPRPYRPLRDASPMRRLFDLLGDPATWRDLLWLLVNCVVGFAASLVVLSVFAGVLWWLLLPLLWAIVAGAGGTELAADVLQTELGIWRIDSQTSAFAAPVLALLLGAVWWWLAPALLGGWARLSAALLRPAGQVTLAARVDELTETRADAVDASAAELRRIERDLHDGAQARLVALGMSLGMAEELLRTDPDAAARLVAEAREDTGLALTELRDLVRGIHPPVLADRGLVGALQALALGHPVPVEVTGEVPTRPPAPVESAAYFAVLETLTNVTKHADATAVTIGLDLDDEVLRVTVTDDGAGGAQVTSGGGLHGIRRRLAAFDGRLHVHSPVGGPTVVTLELPCASSSPRTTPSSATD